MPPTLGALDSRMVRRDIGIGMEQAQSYMRLPQLAHRTRSRSAFEEQGIITTTPRMREATDGGVPFEQLDTGKVLIYNKVYRSGLDVRREDWERAHDFDADIRDRMQAFGRRSEMHWAELVAALLDNGAAAASLAYDDIKFFAASGAEHPNGSGGAIINDIAVGQNPLLQLAGATPTGEEIVDAVLGSIGYMKRYKDDQGGLVNSMVGEWMVELPLGLWAQGFKAGRQSRFDVGSSNVLVDVKGNEATVSGDNGEKITIRSNELISPSFFGFYLLVAGGGDGSKAFILQDEIPLEINILDRNTALEFWDTHGKARVSAYARRGAGYGNFRKASRNTFTPDS